MYELFFLKQEKERKTKLEDGFDMIVKWTPNASYFMHKHKSDFSILFITYYYILKNVIHAYFQPPKTIHIKTSIDIFNVEYIFSLIYLIISSQNSFLVLKGTLTTLKINFSFL